MSVLRKPLSLPLQRNARSDKYFSFRKKGQYNQIIPGQWDNILHNAGLRFVLSGVSLYEARLGCHKGVKKIKHDGSNELPVWISSNLNKDSDMPKHCRTSYFGRGRRMICKQSLGQPVRVHKTSSKKT